VHKTILSTALSLFLGGSGLTLALDGPSVPQPAKEARGEAGLPIAAETAAAIQALGANPSPKQISAIVFKAVRSSPDSVLPIVAATVSVSPRVEATGIVAAATTAVPNPWKRVIYRRLKVLNARTPSPEDESKRDGSLTGGPAPKQPSSSIRLSAQVASNPGTGDFGASSAVGIPMTLAEAIVRTAFDTEPRLPYAELQDAVNVALRMDPGTLMRNIQNPSAASAVGDAGQSSYGNEPLLTPKQPAVSR
jgi:hypothetical protein